jgi:hypothetical protein
MIIKADKEGIKIITELVDIYLKSTGLNGLRNAQLISASISEITPGDAVPMSPSAVKAVVDTGHEKAEGKKLEKVK